MDELIWNSYTHVTPSFPPPHPATPKFFVSVTKEVLNHLLAITQ